MEPSFRDTCLDERVCNWNGALNETECTDPSLSSHVCVVCENEEECIEGLPYISSYHLPSDVCTVPGISSQDECEDLNEACLFSDGTVDSVDRVHSRRTVNAPYHSRRIFLRTLVNQQGFVQSNVFKNQVVNQQTPIWKAFVSTLPLQMMQLGARIKEEPIRTVHVV